MKQFPHNLPLKSTVYIIYSRFGNFSISIGKNVIFFAFLFIVFTGCSTKKSDSLSEEKQQDFEQEKTTEDQEKKADELLVIVDAPPVVEEIKPTPSADKNELKSHREQKTLEVLKLEEQESDDSSMIDKTNSGHMLERFELILEKQTPFLAFKGFFDPAQFPHIKILPGNNRTETIIILPNTFINNVLLPEREVTSFSVDGILEKMTIDEKVTNTKSGGIDFQVNLTISSIEEHMLVLDSEKSDSHLLTFALQKKKKKKKIKTIATKEKRVEKVVEAELLPPKVNLREAMLLHPVTALMSFRHFDQLNVAILNASPHLGGAQRLAMMLNHQKKRLIEKRMGMKLKIVNISSVKEQTILPKTKIYFHANFFKAALILAEFLPGEQILEPLSDSRGSNLATDVKIYVGNNFE